MGLAIVPGKGYCYAAGMAQLEDGGFYAAAPEKDEARQSACGARSGLGKWGERAMWTLKQDPSGWMGLHLHGGS